MSLINRLLGLTNVPLLLIIVGCSLFSYQWGEDNGRLACVNEKMTLTRKELADTIATLKLLTNNAMQASQLLSEQLTARSVADAKTTQEIRHALKNLNRQPCVFDTGIMQQLNAALERANIATTGGLNDNLPAPDRPR